MTRSQFESAKSAILAALRDRAALDSTINAALGRAYTDRDWCKERLAAGATRRGAALRYFEAVSP